MSPLSVADWSAVMSTMLVGSGTWARPSPLCLIRLDPRIYRWGFRRCRFDLADGVTFRLRSPSTKISTPSALPLASASTRSSGSSSSCPYHRQSLTMSRLERPIDPCQRSSTSGLGRAAGGDRRLTPFLVVHGRSASRWTQSMTKGHHVYLAPAIVEVDGDRSSRCGATYHVGRLVSSVLPDLRRPLPSCLDDR